MNPPESFVRRTVRPLAAYGPPRDPAAVPLHLNESPTDLPQELWSVVLKRMGGGYALLARMPPDPSVN